jgi:hypothetical protein
MSATPRTSSPSPRSFTRHGSPRARRSARAATNRREEYRFSLSGGLNGPPITSRGDRLYNDVEQQYLRVRVQAEPPAIEGLLVGGDWNVRYDRLDVLPATGTGNFNDFMDDIASDTLGIVPDVIETRSELRHVNGGLGVGYRINPTVLLGLEGHAYRSSFDGNLTLVKQEIKELRGGVEFAVTPQWTGRIGGYHRTTDDNTSEPNDESVADAFTAGVGWTRHRHTLDAGIEPASARPTTPIPPTAPATRSASCSTTAGLLRTDSKVSITRREAAGGGRASPGASPQECQEGNASVRSRAFRGLWSARGNPVLRRNPPFESDENR